MTDTVLNLGADANVEKAFVLKEQFGDPALLPTPYATPADFADQYPLPLDTTEIIAMCEEVTLWKALPEIRTSLYAEQWREMTSLAFNSGSASIAFPDGMCPDEYKHDGEDQTVYVRNIGAKKTLSVREIMHSQAVASGGWGINKLVGGFPTSEGVPGGSDIATFQREVVRNLKEKEVRLAMTLVLNGWDNLLVNGDSNNNSYEFDGFEHWATNKECTMHTNARASISGTFSADTFDRFLAESCAKPTHIFGHPQAIQEMLSGYFQLGFAGSQVIQYSDGGRITPGFNFMGFVNTGVGRLAVVADGNFTRTAMGGGTTFQADLWAMRMTHNGEPLVYKLTQIPLSLQDLNPGCTTIAFEVWAATALVIKACCAQARWTSVFTGKITSQCTKIG
jgi:hypothetical protein